MHFQFLLEQHKINKWNVSEIWHKTRELEKKQSESNEAISLNEFYFCCCFKKI
uniref:Uncharacterized protein n=1 Tax=Anguilla anguilla TaxID=7936 RepID=A0A0E9QM57_ANGAN